MPTGRNKNNENPVICSTLSSRVTSRSILLNCHRWVDANPNLVALHSIQFSGKSKGSVTVNIFVKVIGNGRSEIDIENFEFAIQFDSLKKLAFVHKPPQDDHDSIAQKDSITKLIGAFIVICCDTVVDIPPRLIR